MIQETYKIPLTSKGNDTGILQRVDAILEKARKSQVYQEARSVYAKLLMLQIPMKAAADIDRHVRDCLPKAAVAGMCLTLIPSEANEAYLLISLCYFECSIVTILRHDGDPSDYLSAGRKLGHRIAGMRNTKGVEMFGVVLNSDLAPFVEGVSEENSEIPFYGSLAGMNSNTDTANGLENFFDQDNINCVFTQKLPIECFIFGNGFYRSGIVMVVFSGEELHIMSEYLLGWKPLGKEMLITSAPTNVCVETIDNIPATKIFQKYLNVPPDDRFLMNVCDFPMIFERNGCMIARTPPIFDSNGRLFFSGDIHEGERFRLSFANTEELLMEVRESGQRMEEFHPEGLFLVICPNRSIFLGNDAHLEIEPFIRVNPQLITSYGPGEIYRHQGKGGILNSSMLVIGMREGPCPLTPSVRPKEPVSPCRIIPRIARMATFLDATTRELHDTAEIARAANLAKSQFLSNMSHEIRTPINAILGMDEMILRESSEDSILEYAENIRMAGNNLLGLINDILDFSKIESGKMDIIPIEYSLASVLNDLINMIQTRADNKGLTLAVKSAPDLPSILCGDEIRIKQIITNILTNAVKYTERGFVALLVDFEPKDRHTIRLKVSVQDTGIGIKEEDMQRLFSAFERIEEKRNRTIEGTGLGMNITTRLLHLMNSKLVVKSVYGKGSTFSFTLEQKVIDWKPMGNFEDTYQRSFAQRNEYREAFTAPDAHILVVDDTAMNLTVVKGLLKKTKVQIDTAENGYKCLDMVRLKKYDMIFLDHRMPGIDGNETLKRMLEMPDSLNPDTPVISLTADALSGARERYIAAGFKDYLTKPIDGHQLEAMMVRYLPPDKISTRVKDDDADQENENLLPEWLSNTSDLDTAKGIEYCGSESAYLDALTVFAESIVPNTKEIAQFYETENWKDFTTKVHALKSTSRLIGANELSERARALEAAGNCDDIETIRNDTDDLLQLYLTYAFKLAPLCKTEEINSDELPAIDEASLEEAYITMEEVAASFDYESLLFLLQSISEYRLPESEATRRDALFEAARKPDWDRIKELLANRKT